MPARFGTSCSAGRITSRGSDATAPRTLIHVADDTLRYEAVQLQFIKNPPLDGAKVIAFVRARRGARLTGPDKLRIEAKLPAWQERAQAVKEILQSLAA